MIELLYYLVYAIGIKENILTKNSDYLDEFIKNIKTDILEIKESDIENIKTDVSEIKEPENHLIKAFQKLSKYKLELSDLSNLTDKEQIIKKIILILEEKRFTTIKNKVQNEEIENRIKTGLNVAIVYETNNGIYTVRYLGTKVYFECIKSYTEKQKETEFNLENFFYSVSLNFSHHALNSKTLGEWIDSLFHKNDAYTMPKSRAKANNDAIVIPFFLDFKHSSNCLLQELMS